MQYLMFFMLACVLTILTACGPQPRDYKTSALCQDKGYKPGTQGYDDCMKEEQMLRLQEELERREEMQRQREEQQRILRY